MPEDAQPNDLRGRSVATAIPSIRPARNVPQSRIATAHPHSFKRSSDRSYPAFPAKRRRLDKPVQKEIRLPPACRKGAVGCHRERKQFIAHEIERLQKSVLGLKVISHSFVGDAVLFACTQADILNCSLAPAPSLNGTQPNEPQQLEVEPPSEYSPPPNPIISTVVGPPRIFQSGTLSFSPGIPVEAPRESVVVGRTSGALETHLDDPKPAAEVMFGKHGPPKATSAVTQTSKTPVSAAGSGIVKPTSLPGPRESLRESVVVSRASSALDDPKPVAEIMFGKHGPPRPASTTTSKNNGPLSTLGSGPSRPRPPTAPRDTSRESAAWLASDLDDPVPVSEIMFGMQGPPKLPPSTARSSVPPMNTIIMSNLAPRSVKPTPATASIPVTHSPSLPNIAAQPNSTANVHPIPSTSHPLEPSLVDHAYELDGDEFRIPFAQQRDKLRRFLCDSLQSSVTVSMYGTVEGVDVVSRKHWLLAHGPNPTKEAVDDACLVNDGNRSVVILAHGRDNQQLSLLNPHNSLGAVSAVDLKRPWSSARKGGVSAVASMIHPLMFASGGYDHCVHLWSVKADLSSASPTALSIKHNSQIQSLLAIHDSSHKLVSAGADCSVNIWDLSSERVVHSLKTSNSVYHAHPTTSPFCTLLEVAHCDLQFELRDHRLIPTVPIQRFGYITPQSHGRFMKGTLFSNCFASGDRGGCVRVWDLRNIEKPCAQIECFDGQKIAHVVSHSSRLLACSENNQIRTIKYDQAIL
ncbi:WD40-repeat-containing domain protein [Mycena alexandri]|uniref:WD40-repeat-containing domain protein n=1 Tax=Mycena alexandri TaxID=1745969 RepID=A0AAD6TKB4_9AGAR|nr:WD40-repeat-containing domain protein [Mycena alexandri]